jgi:hypothetical protein
MDGKNEMKCTRGSSVWPRLHANGDFNKRSMRGSKAWKSSIPATLLFAIERSVAIINSLPEETHIHVLGASGFESDSDWRILRQGLSKIAPHIKSVHMLLTNSGDGWLVDDKGGYNQTEDSVEALEGHSQQRLRLGCRGFPEDGLHVKCADVLYSDKYKDRKPDLVFLKDPGANLPTSTAHCSALSVDPTFHKFRNGPIDPPLLGPCHPIPAWTQHHHHHLGGWHHPPSAIHRGGGGRRRRRRRW